MNLIPQVKELVPSRGTCRTDALTVLNYAGLNKETLMLLRERFPKLKVKKEKKGCFAEFSCGGTLPAADAGTKPDAYVLRVTENAIRIDAASESGLFYGIQTFLQLPRPIPCLEIRDYAAIPLRMIHWDLKGYQPKPEVLKEELRLLASYKINSILLEIEDKYDYRCAPGVGVRGAYTFEEMREISRYAKSMNIMIVPKLQSLAHVDYLLKHARYAKLREDGHPFQYCASNPSAQKLWESMADELMECFAEHKEYFHIGADETDLLGRCEKCSKLGKGGSYIHKVERCIDFLLSRGRTPVMWDDILRNLHGILSEQEARACWKLGKKAILMYWAYGYGGVNNVFPFLHEYRSAGMRVWGASGFAGCDNWAGALPPLEIRALNLDAWTKSAIENELECVVATGWTRIASADCPAEPHESSWFTVLYAAQSMWSGKHIHYERFVLDLARNLYGTMLDEALAASVMNIARTPYSYDKLPVDREEDKRLRFLRYVAAAESLATDRTRLANYLQYYDGQLGGTMPDYRLNMLKKYSASLAEKLEKFKAEMRTQLEQFYTETTVDDFIRSRFGYLEKLTADFRSQLAETGEC